VIKDITLTHFIFSRGVVTMCPGQVYNTKEWSLPIAEAKLLLPFIPYRTKDGGAKGAEVVFPVTCEAYNVKAGCKVVQVRVPHLYGEERFGITKAELLRTCVENHDVANELL
jgi:hypothetical protein